MRSTTSPTPSRQPAPPAQRVSPRTASAVPAIIAESPFATAQRAQIARTFGAAIQRKANNTGLPDNLKSGVESLSGMSMDSVRVHYNSAQPSQLNAHAYAQGTDIHVAPGQEKHLPHEAWHVVQQAQGRVRPTMQMKTGLPVNDDRSLEQEADSMGAQAAAGQHLRTTPVRPSSAASPQVAVQRKPVPGFEQCNSKDSIPKHWIEAYRADIRNGHAHLYLEDIFRFFDNHLPLGTEPKWEQNHFNVAITSGEKPVSIRTRADGNCAAHAAYAMQDSDRFNADVEDYEATQEFITQFRGSVSRFLSGNDEEVKDRIYRQLRDSDNLPSTGFGPQLTELLEPKAQQAQKELEQRHQQERLRFLTNFDPHFAGSASLGLDDDDEGIDSNDNLGMDVEEDDDSIGGKADKEKKGRKRNLDSSESSSDEEDGRPAFSLGFKIEGQRVHYNSKDSKTLKSLRQPKEGKKKKNPRKLYIDPSYPETSDYLAMEYEEFKKSVGDELPPDQIHRAYQEYLLQQKASVSDEKVTRATKKPKIVTGNITATGHAPLTTMTPTFMSQYGNSHYKRSLVKEDNTSSTRAFEHDYHNEATSLPLFHWTPLVLPPGTSEPSFTMANSIGALLDTQNPTAGETIGQGITYKLIYLHYKRSLELFNQAMDKTKKYAFGDKEEFKRRTLAQINQFNVLAGMRQNEREEALKDGTSWEELAQVIDKLVQLIEESVRSVPESTPREETDQTPNLNFAMPLDISRLQSDEGASLKQLMLIGTILGLKIKQAKRNILNLMLLSDDVEGAVDLIRKFGEELRRLYIVEQHINEQLKRLSPKYSARLAKDAKSKNLQKEIDDL